MKRKKYKKQKPPYGEDVLAYHHREFRGNLTNVNGHRITYVVSTDSTDIKVLISNDEDGQQICIVYGKEKVTFYARQKTDGVWSEWKEFGDAIQIDKLSTEHVHYAVDNTLYAIKNNEL